MIPIKLPYEFSEILYFLAFGKATSHINGLPKKQHEIDQLDTNLPGSSIVDLKVTRYAYLNPSTQSLNGTEREKSYPIQNYSDSIIAQN